MLRLIPTRIHLWQTLRLVGACVLSFYTAVLAGLPEHYWALITTVVVLQPMFSDTLHAGRDRILGTLIGAAVGFLVLELGQRGFPLLPLFWTAFVPVAILVAIFPHLRLSAVTLIIVVLVPGSNTPYIRPFDRVVEILLGTIASIVVAALIRPKLSAKREPSQTIE